MDNPNEIVRVSFAIRKHQRDRFNKEVLKLKLNDGLVVSKAELIEIAMGALVDDIEKCRESGKQSKYLKQLSGKTQRR